MSNTLIPLQRRKFAQTTRQDGWWIQPLAILLGLSAFIVYANWAAFQGEHYHWGPYLSPFYSPELFGDSPHSMLGPRPSWLPAWVSPALLILWAPAGFRLTCYYYRGAYYKSFWGDPPACAVGELRNGYRGENKLPLIMQNLHRYFLYLALIFLVLLAYDAWKGMWFKDALTGQVSFGIGIGTLVLIVNVCLLGGYTLGCHSLRHLVGGRLDEMSNSPVCQKAYKCVSCFNGRHMLFAWMSLVWVAFSDVYIRLCSMGVLSDWRIF